MACVSPSHVLAGALLVELIQAADSCFYRTKSIITPVSTGSHGWYACNNVLGRIGETSACCRSGTICGQNSICYWPTSDGGSNWYVGGCTSPSYASPICSLSCTTHGQTWVEYNGNTSLWHCCGDNGCYAPDPKATNETFRAATPDEQEAYSPLVWTTATAATATVTVTTTAQSVQRERKSLWYSVIALGGILALILLGFVDHIVRFTWPRWRQRRRALKNDTLAAFKEPGGTKEASGPRGSTSVAVGTPELDLDTELREMAGLRSPVEIEQHAPSPDHIMRGRTELDAGAEERRWLGLGRWRRWNRGSGRRGLFEVS